MAAQSTYLPRTSLIRHISSNALPEIAPLPPAALPLPSIRQPNLVAHSRITVDIVKQVLSRLDKRRDAPRRIQVQQHRLSLIPPRPADIRPIRGRHGAIRDAALCIDKRDDGRILGDKIAPDLAERVLEAGTGRRRPGPQRLQIVPVVGWRRAELVLPCHGERRCRPVARTYKGVLAEDGKYALLLARAEGRLVDGARERCAACCEEGVRGVRGVRVAGIRVMRFYSGFLGSREAREGRVDVGPEVLESEGSWWSKGNAFARHVAREDAFSFQCLGCELYCWKLLDKRSIGDGDKGKHAKWTGF
jgi:hypothetical protein